MQRRFKKTKSFNAVAPGQTATLDLPTNAIYHMLQVKYFRNGVAATEAQMKSDLTRFRLKINGKTQREFTAAQLFLIQAVRRLSVTAGILPIWLAKPWARDGQGEDALAWGTKNIESLQLEIDIAAGAVSPTLECVVLIEDGGANRDIGAIEMWTSHTVPVTAIGNVDFVPNIEPLHSYYALECFSNDINSVEVKLDSEVKFEGSPLQFNSMYKDQELAPQSGLTSILWDHTDRVSDSLPVAYANGTKARDFVVKFAMGAATSFEVISRRLGSPL